MRNKNVKHMALCGVLAANAIVIMCMGGLIPIATYICPILCILTGDIVQRHCGTKLCFTWYVAVSILSLLLGPDREAVVVYVILGNYPCFKTRIDRLSWSVLWKALYFNFCSVLIYLISVYFMGLSDIVTEFQTIGYIGLVCVLVLTNITLFLGDFLLTKIRKISPWQYKLNN